jgi:nitroimidazol reductase NimA-like FMN-containing flavoprotein (pyridoxamine 5'-phosphate oxidase superfamily)
MEIDRDGLEVLDRAECLRLLDGRSVGRIAGTFGALPVVLPVEYVMDGDSIVLETGRGTTLGFATAGAVVAFEVDNLHEHGHNGWTVMVTGVAEEVPDGPERDRLRSLLPDEPDDRDDRDVRFVRISSEIVSGRRTHPAPRHSRSRATARVAGLSG